MTSVSDIRAHAPVRLVRLSCELVDLVSEAVACPPDPPSRSAAISALVAEVYETMQWLHRNEDDHEELVSLRRLVVAAQAHQDRMNRSAGVPDDVA